MQAPAHRAVAVPVVIEDGCKERYRAAVAVPVVIEDGCKPDGAEFLTERIVVAVPVAIEDGCKNRRNAVEDAVAKSQCLW